MENGIKKTLSSDKMDSGMRKAPSTLFSITELDDLYFQHLSRTPRLNIERKISLDDCSISGNLRHVDSHESMSPMGGFGHRAGFDTPHSTSDNVYEPHMMVVAAWEALRKSIVYFRGQPVGTVAACDFTSEEALNYDQVFVRDFVPSALAFLMNGEYDIVKNFLLKTLQLQSWEKKIDRFKLGEGVMPASFKVLHDSNKKIDTILADFGESAIGRVAPVDSGFWWIILLRAYTK